MTRNTKRAGYSILEMLVALVILSVALVSVVPVFINYASVNRTTEIRAEAVSVAEQVMDGLRQRDFVQWGDYETAMERDGVQVVTGAAGDDSDDGRTYKVDIEWCNAAVTGLTLCDNQNGVDGVQQRHVRVTASFNNCQVSYSVTTVFALIQGNQANAGGGRGTGSCLND